MNCSFILHEREIFDVTAITLTRLVDKTYEAPYLGSTRYINYNSGNMLNIPRMITVAISKRGKKLRIFGFLTVAGIKW